jgi:hypothetical protein
MYFDHTLAVDTAGGYGNIHCKQWYDLFAADMTARGNWTLVDTVDSVSGAFTHRRFVWRCAAPGNGLPADFYLIWECQFTTATGAWTQSGTSSVPWVSIAEGYNSTTKVATKYAPVASNTAQVLGSDLTNTGTWTLSTNTRPAQPNQPFYASPGSGALMTSQKVLVVVTASTVVAFSNLGAASAAVEFYAGAFDSVMSSALDPMPIVVAANAIAVSNGATESGVTTRHPRLTPGGSYASVFGHAFSPGHTSTGGATFGAGAYAVAATGGFGALGDPSNTGWNLFTGGVVASRVCLSTQTAGQSGSTRGGLHGFLRHVLAAVTAVHSIGDVFSIDGKNYVGQGSASASLVRSVMDMTA